MKRGYTSRKGRVGLVIGNGIIVCIARERGLGGEVEGRFLAALLFVAVKQLHNIIFAHCVCLSAAKCRRNYRWTARVRSLSSSSE